MLRLIQLLLTGCWHVWETVEIENRQKSWITGGYQTYKRYHLRCTKCGEVRKRDLI